VSTRVIAVDWTGAKEPVKNLWMAEAAAGKLIGARSFGTRAALVDHLLDEARLSRDLVVGLDFAFSLPQWFLRNEGLADHRALWRHMAARADEWLKPTRPFWGNGGKPKKFEGPEFRVTDDEVGKGVGRRPTSPFKLVGADQVGRGSLRGMAHLERLVSAEPKFHVWPFESGWPLVVEIYPARLVPPGINKSSPHAIADAVRRHPSIPNEWKAHAACSQDAFDAALSALRMEECIDELRGLRKASAPSAYAVEGRIWIP